ncbi:MAG TPA: hypothetical protein VFM37_14975 [Pseudonocardiaceae bacterium]|nr:hypothetical protein [Pseudonocardiaceae bacterium]
MTVKIAAKWKKDERGYNGLESILHGLVDDGLNRRYAVVLLETVRVTREIADGDVEIPTVRIVHIEPLDGEVAAVAKRLLDEAYRARAGNAPQDQLPLGDQGGEPVSERQPDEWLDDEPTTAKKAKR